MASIIWTIRKKHSLYDVAAVYLAYSNAAFVMEEKPMIVKDGIFVDSEDAPNRVFLPL